MGRTLRGVLELLEEIAQRFGQVRLIILHSQDVVGTTIPDRLGDARLGPHGIDGNDTAFQRQSRQQFGDRRLLVRLRRRRPLPDHHTGAGSKGADQMQRRGIHLARAPAGLAIDGNYSICI